MVEESPILDLGRQEKARAYARLRRRLWAIESALGGLYLFLWAGLRWSVPICRALAAVTAGGMLPFDLPWWISVLLMALAVGLPWSLLALPLSFYRGFILPHRYGLSTQTLRGWLTDSAKGIALSITIGAPMLVGLYALLRQAPQVWWLWAASGYTLATAVLTALAPILLMPIFYKIQPLDTSRADLAQRLTALARAAGAEVRGVFKFDMSRRTRAANAALVGLSRTRRIILGDTLLSEFTNDEIETVLAHELGHHVHQDIPLSLLVQTAFNFLAFFLAASGLRWYVTTFALTGLPDPAGLPFLMAWFGFLGFATMPVANAFSRWRERLADSFALRLTNKPSAFADAMTRLANQNLAQVDPEPWVVFLFYSHPPLKERIRRARSFAPKTG
ncbi:MAG: M48 family metallopeptidase [Anaerolineales bacterium]|jgi:STE24 endopeptidase